jgi:hypothetical protein
MTFSIFKPGHDFHKTFFNFLSNKKDETQKMLFEAHKKAQEAAKKRRRSGSKKIGSVGLSNADSVGRAVRIRARLYAKLDEIFASDLDLKVKMSLAKDVMVQINRVEQKITDIQRRERAIKEEALAKSKDEPEHVKRRRRYDMQKRGIAIRRDYLYHANDGGFDPMSFCVNAMKAAAAVAFDIAGVGGEMLSPQVSEGMVEVNV